jgi:hypothetical protein
MFFAYRERLYKQIWANKNINKMQIQKANPFIRLPPSFQDCSAISLFAFVNFSATFIAEFFVLNF